jgi:hypothetical protein
VSREVLTSAAVALVGCAVAAFVLRGRLAPRKAALLLALAVLADLARAGAGINPQVDPAFFRPLPEMQRLSLAGLGGGRVFSYGLDYSPEFLRFLHARTPGSAAWSFYMSRQVLAPYANMIEGVEVAEAKDLTSFVLRPPLLGPDDYDPAAVGSILDRLRSSAVTSVLSLDPLVHPDLEPRAAVAAGPPGVLIHAYALRNPWPRAFLACADPGAGPPSREIRVDGAADCAIGPPRLAAASPDSRRYEVEARAASTFVARDAYARGWKATLDGSATALLRVNERHMGVVVPAGRHVVAFHYEPPGLKVGIVAFAMSLLATGVMLFRGTS